MRTLPSSIKPRNEEQNGTNGIIHGFDEIEEDLRITKLNSSTGHLDISE
jgi:hypothetical protein